MNKLLPLVAVSDDFSVIQITRNTLLVLQMTETIFLTGQAETFNV